MPKNYQLLNQQFNHAYNKLLKEYNTLIYTKNAQITKFFCQEQLNLYRANKILKSELIDILRYKFERNAKNDKFVETLNLIAIIQENFKDFDELRNLLTKADLIKAELQLETVSDNQSGYTILASIIPYYLEQFISPTGKVYCYYEFDIHNEYKS